MAAMVSPETYQGIVMKLRWLRGFIAVDLGYNDIDDGCLQPLKNLMALRQLRHLDLRGNELGPSAGKALLESLPRCKGLQVFKEDVRCSLFIIKIYLDKYQALW